MVEYKILLCEDFPLGENTIKRGDVDEDGVVSTSDVLMLSKPDELTEAQKLIADVNNDGKIDNKDAEEILRIASGSSWAYTIGWREKAVCEIGSSSSTFPGRAIDPVFTSRIDGTHELTFSLPRYYLDEDSGEKVLNELPDYISNKSKIKFLRKKGKSQSTEKEDWEEFFLVVNDRRDLESANGISYEFSCSDAYIEELSKTGYGLMFSADYDVPEENLGLGTIHQLAKRILSGTLWKYKEEKTGHLQEYSTDLVFNAEQGRFDTIRTPRPVNPVKYIPALKRYCYETIFTQGDKPVYCYEDSEQFTSSTTQDLLYNADSTFTDLTGWTSFLVRDGQAAGLGVYTEPGHVLAPYQYTDSEGKPYYSMHITRESLSDPRYTYLMNEGAALAGRRIKANTPYLLKCKFGESSKGKITKIIITSKNPLSEGKKQFIQGGTPDYSQVFSIPVDEDTCKTNYFVIKSPVSINTPYITFMIDGEIEEYGKKKIAPIYLYSASLFEVKAKNTAQDPNPDNSNSNYLQLLGSLSNGKVLSTNNSNDSKLMNLIDFPDTATPSAYTQISSMYFVEDGDESVTYIDITPLISYTKQGTVTLKEITSKNPPILEDDEYAILKETGQYYQCYRVPIGKDEQNKNIYAEGSEKWNLAFLKTSDDKIRTLQAEKSNRFNLLQELCELFSVWPVFSMTDVDGIISREMWFKEHSLNTVFSGFHKGINIDTLERNSDSNEIVTKIYVEDQENQYADNGFVTIRTAAQNPWGENFFYNFKYYVQQGLLDGEEVDKDLNFLYPEVKSLNFDITLLNEDYLALKTQLKEYEQQQVSLTYGYNAATERVASINADLNNKSLQIPESEKKKLKETRDKYLNQQESYRKKISDINNKIAPILNQIKNKQADIADKTERKKSLINTFESKYINFIKEGVWADSSYIDNDAYYYDAQKVSNTSAVPITSWNIGVLDTAVVEEMEDFVFKVGDQTILVDNDFFGVKKDYQKNHMFEVLITATEEHLEDGLSNRIEVRNYSTSFEDLFQRISAVTQTVELKEQIYNKADYFTKEGRIDSTILQNTLLDNAYILANASDNSYKLDETGLSLQSILNPSKQTRLIAEGLFFSNSRNLTTGEQEWKTGITADGINASFLTAGQIDTSLVRILSNGQPSFSWGELGISAYCMPTKNDTIIGDFLCIGDSYATDYGARWQKFEATNEEKKQYKDTFIYDYDNGEEGSFQSSYYYTSVNGSYQRGKLIQIQEEEDLTYCSSWPKMIEEKIHNKVFSVKRGGAGFCAPAVATFDKLLQEYIDRRTPKSEEETENTGDGTETTNAAENTDDLSNVTHVIIGCGFNDRMVEYNGVKGATAAELKAAMKRCQEKIDELFEGIAYPKIILVAMGVSYTGGDKNYDLEREGGVYATYKQFCLENDWIFVDIHTKWMSEQEQQLLPHDSTARNSQPFNSVAFYSDGIHPKQEGARRIAELICQDCFTEGNLISNNGAFMRLDSFGFYKINKDNAAEFSYDSNDLPWFEGLTRSQATRKISDLADYYLNDVGFGLHVTGDRKANLRLGYDSEGSGAYGLFITDSEGNTIVRLANSGVNTIAGWQVRAHTLFSEYDTGELVKSGEDHTWKRKMYLMNATTSDIQNAFVIGKISSADKDFRNAQFRVTAGGALYATNAVITGNGTFSGTITADQGYIGPFKITHRLEGQDQTVARALIVSNSNETWETEVKERIKEAYNVEAKSLGVTAPIGGKNRKEIVNYIPVGKPNGDSLYVKKVGDYTHYFVREIGGTDWKEIKDESGKIFLTYLNTHWTTSAFTGKCYYIPTTKILYYHTDTWYSVKLTELTSDGLSNLIANKEIVTASTTFTERKELPIYWVRDAIKNSDGKFTSAFARNKGKGEFITFGTQYLGEIGRTNVIYWSNAAKGILHHNSSTKKWEFVSTTEESKINAIFKGHDGDFLTIKGYNNFSDIPEPIWLWYDATSYKNAGYWFQNPEKNYQWQLSTVQTGLGIIGNTGYVYETDFNVNGKPLQFEYNKTKKAWVSCSGKTNAKKSLTWDPGRPRSQNKEEHTVFYHSLLGSYRFFRFIDSGNPPVIKDGPLNDLLTQDSISMKNFYHSPSGYYYYYNDTKKKWDYAHPNHTDDEHKMITMMANIECYGSQLFREFAQTDVSIRYQRIVLGASMPEEVNDFNTIYAGLQYLKKVVEENGFTQDTNSGFSMKEVTPLISSISDDTIAGYYDRYSGFTFINGKGKTVKEIAESLPIYSQKRYGSFIGIMKSSTARYTAGFALESLAPSSVVLWSGYTSDTYDSPFQDYSADTSTNQDRWQGKTNFYVQANGNLHAKNTYITNTTISGLLSITTKSGSKIEVVGRQIYNGDVATGNYYPSILFYDQDYSSHCGELFMDYNAKKNRFRLNVGNSSTAGIQKGKFTTLVEVDSNGTLHSDTLAFKNALDERGDKIDENINDVWEQVDKNTADIKNMSTTVGSFNGRINANAAAIDTKLAKRQFTYIYQDIKFGTIKDFIINAPEAPNGKVAFQGPFPVLLINFRGKYFPLGAVPNPAFPEGDSPVIIFGNTILQPYQMDEYNVEYSQNNLTRLEIE